MTRTLASIQELDEFMETGGLALLFKHSTRCPISASAKSRFDAFMAEESQAALPAAFVFVVEDREVSNAVAARLGVTHQSPQAILLRDGKAVWNTSHHDIKADTLRAAITVNA